MMSLSRLAMVLDLQYEDVIWMGVWILAVFAVIITGIVTSTIITSRSWFIRNELPRLHNKQLQKEMDKNKMLQDHNKRLLAKNKALEIRNDELKARFMLVKSNFDEGAKGIKC